MDEVREQYIDLEVKEQMQRELNYRVANRLVQDAAQAGRRYQMAILSAATGRWGDVWKDVRRKRITTEQAQAIVDSLKRARLIGERQVAYYKEHIECLTIGAT